MLYSVLLSTLHLFLILDVIHSEKPPTVKASFYAYAEVFTKEGDEITSTIVFEESFDHENGFSAADYRLNGTIIRFYEDIKLSQTFAYLKTTSNDKAVEQCIEVTPETWILMDIEPHLKSFQVMNGKIMLPLRQLLTMQEKGLVDKSTTSTYRGVPAQKWIYEFPEGDKIDAYWSIGDWNSPSKYHAVPLGFKTTHTNGTVNHINIMNFQHDLVESSLFEPVRGIYCEEKTDQLYPFPKVVEELLEFSYSMEVVLQEDMLINTVDTWVDLHNKFIRTDYDPFGRDSNEYHTFTEIVSFTQGATYEITRHVDEGCLVDPIDYNSDMQILFDYTNGSKWNGKGFFGLDQTEYIYAGDTMERGIPCKLFQGMRKDFPYGSKNFETLWEWCITDKLKNGINRAIPIVSLNIYFKKVDEKVKTQPQVKQGSRLTYHFYNAQPYFEITSLLSEVFDIENCFAAENKTDRMLVVQVTDKVRGNIQQLVHDVTFVSKWWTVLLENSGLRKEALRLTNIRLRIGEKGPLNVFFTILNSHYDLPTEIQAKELLLELVLQKLEQAVKTDKIKINQIINGETITLVAESMEAVARLGTLLAANTRLLSPESNPVNSSMKSDAIAVQFSPEMPSQHKSKSIDGWALGIVLGVGGAMLVSGVGLGIFSGAGRIALKRKYAPSSN